MATTKLIIPERLKVGFNKRSDCYTGKLAYVIYYDHTGKLRKEQGWNSWREKDIEPVEHTNNPTEGFVLNKGVGGTRHSYGWNTRNEYIRVYDPRDFEFEISVANLLFILRECDCSKGKGLEGKFVYAWDGKELVLLPEKSQDFQESKKYTELQKTSVSAKDLVAGATYDTKDERKLIYLGRFDYRTTHEIQTYTKNKTPKKQRKHIFWDGKSYAPLDNLKMLSRLVSPDHPSNYAELVDNYNKGIHGSAIAELFMKEGGPELYDSSHRWRKEYFYKQNSDGSYDEWWAEYDGPSKEISEYNRYYTYGLINNILTATYRSDRYYPIKNKPVGSHYYHSYGNYTDIQPTNTLLFARLESGVVFRVKGGGLTENKNGNV